MVFARIFANYATYPMHELGVVLHIIDSVEEIANQHKATHINVVTIELGEVSGVVPSLLKDCWRWACDKRDLMNGCQLKIEGIKAITHCDNCGKDYPTTVFEKVCPYCDSDDTYLIQGQEFNIKDIAVEED